MPLTSTPPGTRRLAVGRVAFLLDGADLRYVTVDGVELLRRVGAPLRDETWGTLEPDAVEVEVIDSAAAIEVRARARHRSAAADVRWTVLARAAASGELSYEVAFMPDAAFAYARMGICLLHPPQALIGRRYVAQTVAGEISGVFERPIAPQRIEAGEILPLFKAFSALRLEQPDGGEVVLRFEGDLFETEDQRNWCDGSFKTYCTPLSVPRPHRAVPGRRVEQRVALTPSAPRASGPAPRADGAVALEVAAEPLGATMPRIGLALAPEPLVGAAPLRELGLEHLRVDVREPCRAAAAELLARAAEAAAAADAELAVAVHVADAAELDVLADALATHARAIARVLVFERDGEASPGPLVAAARHRLAGRLPRARFAGGTDLWFAQLNRARPDVAAMDGVAWSVTPQVHGSDELTIVEGLAALSDQVATARAFAPGLELLVGPVTLRPRCNPAADDAREQALHPPPASIDPRQGELFAAAWTAGGIAQLAAAGADAVTWFETHGPRGAMDATGAPLPCWHPLADACAWSGWEVLPVDNPEPLAVQLLAVRDPTGRATGLLLANLRAEPTAVELAGLPAADARLRVLDATTRATAYAEPRAFRACAAGQPLVGGALRLTLAAHAVATVLVGAGT